jgi:hypothetical protein
VNVVDDDGPITTNVVENDEGRSIIGVERAAKWRRIDRNGKEFLHVI